MSEFGLGPNEYFTNSILNLKVSCEHEEVKEWYKPLVPPCLWKARMTNLNSEAIFASPSYVCGRERKHHTSALARLAGLGSGWGEGRGRATSA